MTEDTTHADATPKPTSDDLRSEADADLLAAAERSDRAIVQALIDVRDAVLTAGVYNPRKLAVRNDSPAGAVQRCARKGCGKLFSHTEIVPFCCGHCAESAVGDKAKAIDLND